MNPHLLRSLTWALLLLAIAGCSRSHYRLRADKDAYKVLGRKTACRPWEPPPGFTIYPHPQSRFYDPTSPDDPTLPIPTPELYAYELPELPERDPGRFRPGMDGGDGEERSNRGLEFPAAAEEPSVVFAGWDRGARPGSDSLVRPAAFQQAALSREDLAVLRGDPSGESDAALNVAESIVAIPKQTWESVPVQCLRRMFEFPSIRDEYRRSYGTEPPDSLRDASQRLSLEDIVQLALINSREYQTQKERLYQAALQVSLARFDFELKFAGGSFANSSAVDWTHRRSGGITENNLFIPSTLSSDRLMATGGSMLANFANEVLLTFNGPSGFSADIGSEILYDIAQPLIQRDIVLEQLTQIERNLVYAARDYARFRKVFFNDLAVRYYRLLLTYRNIEIESQNFFSNLRGFLQSEAEFRADQLERFEVDQFEQSALVSRGSLITRCNALENSLDALKFDIGLPPELPLNLDLTELNELTLRDEGVVLGEGVRRARRNLRADIREESVERRLLLNSAINLLRLIPEFADIRRRRGEDIDLAAEFRTTLLRLRVEAARQAVRLQQDLYDDAFEVGLPLQEFLRTMALADAILVEAAYSLEYAENLGADPDRLRDLLQTGLQLRKQQERLSAEYDAIFERDSSEDSADEADRGVSVQEILEIPEKIRALKEQADGRLAEVTNYAQDTEELLPPREKEVERVQQLTLQEIDRLLQRSEEILAQQQLSLVPVEIGVDEAMLTAITQRFELMNQRESLADGWRAVKLTADDLKSILNLRATQQIRTESGVNRPFAFTFDDSTTRVALRFDAPLNRRSQRNSYRNALIDYNVGLRSLLQAEDGIKLAVRQNLRELALQRELYDNAVANAALAYQRLFTTRIQLRYGLSDVRALDVLLAQDDYTQSLLAVARNHIDYLLQRIQLFLDLELLQVDQMGFWPQLYDESYQPTPHFEIPGAALPVYGELPCGTLHSHKIKRMLRVPAGSATIYGAPGETGEPDTDAREPVGDAAGPPGDAEQPQGDASGGAGEASEAPAAPGEPEPLLREPSVLLPGSEQPLPLPPVEAEPPPAVVPLPAPAPPL